MAAVSAPRSLISLSSHRRTFPRNVATSAAANPRRDSHQDNEPKLTQSKQSHQQQRPYPNNGYLPNGVPESNLSEKQTFMNNQARVLQTGGSRILCVADVRGELLSLNQLAKDARADYIIHTGDFGFYDHTSLQRMTEKTLRHVAQYSPLLNENVRRSLLHQTPPNESLRGRYAQEGLPLSQLSQFLNGTYSFDVPVYTVWGACEDVAVLEKLRSGEYKINNLNVIDEAHTKLLEVGGLKLRLLGLGGAIVMHKLFDNGEGRSTIAGGQGTMWTTLLQIGELVDTAQRNYDPSETRIFITHASPAREGLLNQIAVSLKVDFSISAGLHFRYGSSYNEFSVNPTLDHYRGKLAASKQSFFDVWETVRSEVEPAVSENEVQNRLLRNALSVVEQMPSQANGGNPFGVAPGQGYLNAGMVDEVSFKNMWNFNLADAAFGYLVLEVEAGRIGTEMRAQGFNFAHRGQKGQHPTLHADMIKPSVPSPMTGGPGASPMSAPPPYNNAQVPAQAQPRPAGGPVTQPPQGFQQARAQPQQTPTGRTPQPTAAPSQQAAPKAPATTTRPAAAAPSPAPAATPAAAAPSTPQPAATTTAATTTTPATANGTAQPAPTDLKSEATASKDAAAPAAGATAQPLSTSIFLQNVNNEEEVKNVFSEEDRAKITRVDKRGNVGWLAYFSSNDEMRAVYAAASEDLKTYRGRGKPHIKEGFAPGQFSDRKRFNNTPNWGSSTPAPAPASSTNGTPTDGEAIRGRGGFRGRGRGGDRGRGGRGGRGGLNKEGSTSAAGTPAPAAAAASAPAPSASTS